MATARLPAGGNVTGTPAHVLKTVAALEAAGAEVRLIELDTRTPSSLACAAPSGLARLRRSRAAVVHVHGHIPAAAILPGARLLGIPVVVELHGLYVRSSPDQPGSRPALSRLAAGLELPIVRCADHVVVQAGAMRDRLVRAGIPEGRVSVLYPGLRTSEFSGYAGPPAELPAQHPGERCVVYVGSTHRYQGLDLLAASQRLLPEALRVVLVVSSDGADDADVVARFGFDPRRTTVVRPASPAALPAWTRRADVLVHARPDVPDNVNVQSKLGLYLASGRPIVATDIGDYPALLGGSQGCLVVPATPDAVAEALVRAATDPGLRECAERENPALAVRYFESATNARRLLEVYRDCAAARARSRGRA